MNLHFELDGLDWSGTGAQAIEANTDLFWDGASDEVVSMYEDAVELLPSLLENAYAAMWVQAGVYDLLVYSVCETGAEFPADQANAGLDVVLVSDDEVVERDQTVGLETAAEAVFDVMAYAERRGFCPDGEYSPPGGEPLSVVVTDRELASQYLPDIETLVTEEARDARWVAERGAGLGFPSADLLVLPGPYWPVNDDRHSAEFTPEQHEALREELAAHCGRTPWEAPGGADEAEASE